MFSKQFVFSMKARTRVLVLKSRSRKRIKARPAADWEASTAPTVQATNATLPLQGIQVNF